MININERFKNCEAIKLISLLSELTPDLSDKDTQLEKIALMYSAQYKLNSIVHPEWLDQTRVNTMTGEEIPWPFSIALAEECLELISGEWQWWKKVPTPSYNQRMLELVDILHFGLSMNMQSAYFYTGGLDTDTMVHLVEYFSNDFVGREEFSYLGLVKSIAANALGFNTFDVESYSQLCAIYGIHDIHDIYALYGAKCVLNQFRQDHGYKTGNYIKMWHGAEDNVTLMTIVNDSSSKSLQDIYDRLEIAYNTVTRK